MWTCPKCGRTFQRQEQGHYCGKAPETIEGCIEEQPEEIRQYLKEVRDALRAALPEAVQEFSERLKEYKTSKGSIQLPYSRTVPVELISDIARWCYVTGNHP